MPMNIGISLGISALVHINLCVYIATRYYVDVRCWARGNPAQKGNPYWTATVTCFKQAASLLRILELVDLISM